MPNLLENPSQYSRNSLEHKACTTARRIAYRRAAYEGEALNDVAKARRVARKAIAHARDAQTFAIWSRELDRLIERERILLRIPLPRQSESIDVRQATPTVYEIDRSVTAPAVMNEQPAPASPSTPAQPAPSTPTQ